jgi:HEPN domain-containing protein
MTLQREEALRSLRLADRDAAAFEALLRHPEVPPAMACFHAQQAIEKCLKARLVEFRRTHDLIELSDLLEGYGIQLPVASAWLKSLNPFAVAFRYEETELHGLDMATLSEVVRTLRGWAGELVG